jgi:hypothetical protein
MVDFMKSPTKSPLQNYLLNLYPVKLPQLYDVQATRCLYAYDFNAALSYFMKDSSSGEIELLGNPFNARINDCHDCDHAMKQKVKYSKLSFTRKMIELQQKYRSSTDPQEKANNAFLYASALYNMTWYGNARLLSSTVVNWNYTDTYHLNQNEGEERAQSNYYDCHEAQRWFVKAMAESKNSEFQAKSAWMAAKCEHAIWLESDFVEEEGAPDFRAGQYFIYMKAKYANTKYYQEVINECGYFCTYINPGEQKCIKNKDSE